MRHDEREGRPAGPSEPEERKPPLRPRYTLLWLLFLAMLLGLNYLGAAGAGLKEIPYSEFRRMVEGGKIAKAAIEEKRILAEGRPEKVGDPAPVYRVLRVEDPGLIQDLEKAGVEFTGAASSTFLRDLAMWTLPFVLLFFLWTWALRRMGGGAGLGGGIMGFGRTRARLAAPEEARETFQDVAGADEAKAELQEIVQYLRTPDRYRRLGGKIPKGVLLVGPPGTGKTLLARAVAGEAKVPFFSLSGSEFVEMFVGVGAARVRDLFARAKERAPSIVFIDEIDAIGKSRGIGGALTGHDEREQTLNQLLAEMDGFEPNSGVILMAATNRPEILDPALLRAGRFDRQVLVDRPDLAGRRAILEVHVANVKLAPDVSLDRIAQETPGLVGADLANIVNEAALLAARKDRDAVSQADFQEAVDRAVVGLEKKNRIIRPEERRRIAYHEAGHALVAESVPGADPVAKISIVPRGVAALGHTRQAPAEERYLMTKSELEGRLAALLGGRAAEALVFGEASTGAQNDLQRAAEIARAMVEGYGMSERLGPVAFERERRALFLDAGIATPREFSERTAEEIDAEVRAILERAEARAREILERRRAELDAVAGALLERESLDRAALIALLAPREA